MEGMDDMSEWRPLVDGVCTCHHLSKSGHDSHALWMSRVNADAWQSIDA